MPIFGTLCSPNGVPDIISVTGVSSKKKDILIVKKDCIDMEKGQFFLLFYKKSLRFEKKSKKTAILYQMTPQ